MHAFYHMGISAYNVFKYIQLHSHIYMQTDVCVIIIQHVQGNARKGKLGNEERQNSGTGNMSHKREYKVN